MLFIITPRAQTRQSSHCTVVTPMGQNRKISCLANSSEFDRYYSVRENRWSCWRTKRINASPLICNNIIQLEITDCNFHHILNKKIYDYFVEQLEPPFIATGVSSVDVKFANFIFPPAPELTEKPNAAPSAVHVVIPQWRPSKRASDRIDHLRMLPCASSVQQTFGFNLLLRGAAATVDRLLPRRCSALMSAKKEKGRGRAVKTRHIRYWGVEQKQRVWVVDWRGNYFTPDLLIDWSSQSGRLLRISCFFRNARVRVIEFRPAQTVTGRQTDHVSCHPQKNTCGGLETVLH